MKVQMSMLVFHVVMLYGDGVSMFLKNVGIYLQFHMILQLRIPTFTCYSLDVILLTQSGTVIITFFSPDHLKIMALLR
jgi:hypothetical protein